MSKGDFREIASAKIQDKRELVLSERSKGGYTLGQRVLVEEGKKITSVYLKNAIHIDTIDGIENLRDALNVALSEKEN